MIFFTGLGMALAAMIVIFCFIFVVDRWSTYRKRYTYEWESCHGGWCYSYEYFLFRRSAEKAIGSKVVRRRYAKSFRLIDNRTQDVLSTVTRVDHK